MWDATCPDTLAPSYLSIATAEAGAVAREAEHRKQVRYSHLEDSHYFVPIAFETLCALGHNARSFLKELARCIHWLPRTIKPTIILFSVFQWQSRGETWRRQFLGALRWVLCHDFRFSSIFVEV